MIKILHISDTHGMHDQMNLDYINSFDLVVHTGDATNYMDPNFNENEFYDFINWYRKIDIPKIYIAGNHDSYIAANKKIVEKIMKDNAIIYLNKSGVNLFGYNIWGDPTTPTFGKWHFMADRSKTHKHWEMVPDDTHLLFTHGPAKGILDLSINKFNDITLCGDSSLGKRIKKLPNLKVHGFGHIHNSENIENIGLLHRDGIIYSNAAAVMDGNFNRGIIHHGNEITLKKIS